jgi:hypothetical protein
VTVRRPGLVYVRCPRDLRFLNAVYYSRLRAAEAEDAVRAVTTAFSGVRAVWHVTDAGRTRALESALAAAGWSRGWAHVSCGAPTDETPGEEGWTVAEVTTPDVLLEWHRVLEGAFGGRSSPRSS